MVKKIKNILVPLDGSENSIRGLDEAIYLARQCHAQITGVYVKYFPKIDVLHSIGFLDPDQVTKAKKFLESAKILAGKKGILFKYKIIGGNPGFDIVKFAHNKKNKIDVIVIGAKGGGLAREIFLGSTSNYVIHKAKVPVILVK